MAMSKTEIDYLFQAIAPTTERVPTALRSGGDSAGFDNHLSQASASVFDVVRMPSRGDSPATLSRVDDRQSRARYDSNSNGNSTARNDSQNSSRDRNSDVSTPPPTSPQPCEQASESDCAATEAVDTDHDKDKSDDGESAEIGATTQASATQTSVASATQKGEGDAAEQATDEVLAKDVTQLTAEQSSNNGKTAGKKDSQTIAADEALKIATVDDESATATEASAVDESSKTAEETTSANKSKRGKGAETGHADKAEEATQSEKQSGKSNSSADVTGSLADEASLKSSANAEATANAAKSTAATESSEKRSSDDDEPRRGAKGADRSSVGNDAPVAATKVDTSPIVADVVADIADASSKGDATNDAGDKAIKPVAAKTETAIGPLGRAMRAVTDITRGDQAASTDPTPQVDPARFVSRVTKAFQTAHERGGTLQLRLSPPELGAMRIQLSVKDGVMSASLETENANARRVLLDHLPALRERLAEQNIRIDRFDVDVRQENNGGQANPRGSNQNPYQQQPDQSEPRRSTPSQARPSEVAPVELPTVASRISSTGINLVV
jgi:flagellar hook-length control protein FliK